MRTLLVVLAVLAAVAAACFLLVPLITAHLPAILGALGVLLLLTAAFLRKPCPGLHCNGCRHH